MRGWSAALLWPLLLALLQDAVAAGSKAFLRSQGVARDEVVLPQALDSKRASPLQTLQQHGKSGDLSALLHKLRDLRWTMVVGDSVLLFEFLALAQQVKPACGGKLREKLLAEEAPSPLEFLWNEINEYALICRKDGCELLHLGCLHLAMSGNCPSSEPVQCNFVAQPQCSEADWEALVDKVAAPDTVYAVTFHWVPTAVGRKAPDIGKFEEDPPLGEQLPQLQSFKARMDYAREHIGAVVMNSCLHSYAAPVGGESAGGPFAQRLEAFRGLVRRNVELFRDSAVGDFRGPLLLQGCPRLVCARSADAAACAAHEKELGEVDRTLQELAAAPTVTPGIAFLDARSIQDHLPTSVAYADDIHPCVVRVCSWDPSCRKAVEAARREVEQSLAVLGRALTGRAQWYNGEVETYQLLRSSATMGGPSQATGKALANMAYSNLVAHRQRIGEDAAALNRLQALVPQPYGAEPSGACLALLEQWGELL